MVNVNKIYNEDCLKTLLKIEDESVDMVLTSPPYDDFFGKTKAKMRQYKGYSLDFPKIAKEIYRVLKDGRCCVWVVGDETVNFCETLSSFKQAIYFVEECNFKLLDTMIYGKTSGPPQYPNMRRYPQRFEYMFVFVKGKKPLIYNPIKDVKNKYAGSMNKGSTQRKKDGSTKFSGDYEVPKYSIRGNIWFYNTGYNVDTPDKIAMAHPARFPEALAKDHIISWTNEGDLIYDPFMGSGTTAKVAIVNNRKFIGSEMSAEYCQIANVRIAKAMIDKDL